MTINKDLTENMIKTETKISIPFWQQKPEALIAKLGSCLDGITMEHAAHLLKIHGPNTITIALKLRLISLFLDRFKDPLILLLLLAATLVAMIGNIQSSLIIMIILVSSGVDVLQEYRANRAAITLQHSVALRALVWRNNRKKEIPTSKLVPGDIVELTAGDLVPGDGLLLKAKDFFIDQSTFTGESFPVEKHCVADIPSVKKPEESPQTVLMGTAVMDGAVLLFVRQGETLY